MIYRACRKFVVPYEQELLMGIGDVSIIGEQ